MVPNHVISEFKLNDALNNESLVDVSGHLYRISKNLRTLQINAINITELHIRFNTDIGVIIRQKACQ